VLFVGRSVLPLSNCDVLEKARALYWLIVNRIREAVQSAISF
jgi:hypothetical protein